jgi:hypothetical protein
VFNNNNNNNNNNENIFKCVGENPRELRGTNGTCVGGNIDVAARYAWLSGHNIDSANGYEILGTMSGMHANRVSYCLDLKGQSFSFFNNSDDKLCYYLKPLIFRPHKTNAYLLLLLFLSQVRVTRWTRRVRQV